MLRRKIGRKKRPKQGLAQRSDSGGNPSEPLSAEVSHFGTRLYGYSIWHRNAARQITPEIVVSDTVPRCMTWVTSSNLAGTRSLLDLDSRTINQYIPLHVGLIPRS